MREILAVTLLVLVVPFPVAAEPATGRLELTVTESGRPVTTGSVSCFRAEHFIPFDQVIRRWTQWSSPQGKVVIDDLEPGVHRCVVPAGGPRQTVLYPEIHAGQLTERSVELPSLSPLRLRVLEEGTDRPLAGATVIVGNNMGTSDEAGNVVIEVAADSPRVADAWPARLPKGRRGADGVVVYHVSELGRWHATHHRIETDLGPPSDEPIVLRLRPLLPESDLAPLDKDWRFENGPPGTLCVTVLRDGRPWTGVTVLTEHDRVDTTDEPESCATWTRTGPQQVVVMHDHHDNPLQTPSWLGPIVDVKPSEITRVTLRKPARVDLRGHVLRHGRPAPDVSLSSSHDRVSIAPDGSFVTRLPVHRTQRLGTSSLRRGDRPEVEVELLPPFDEPVTIDVGGVTVRGRVLVDGHPEEGVKVEAISRRLGFPHPPCEPVSDLTSDPSDPRTRQWMAYTNAAGDWALEGLHPGEVHDLHASCPGCLRLSRPLAAEPGAPIELNVQRRPGRRLRLLADGRPPLQAACVTSQRGSSGLLYQERVVPDRDGWLTLPLDDAEHALWFDIHGFVPSFHRLKPGKSDDTVHLGRGGALDVTMTLADGRPAWHAQAQVTHWSPGQEPDQEVPESCHGHAQPTGPGQVFLRQLPPGRVRLRSTLDTRQFLRHTETLLAVGEAECTVVKDETRPCAIVLSPP
ncbi:MAG: hypothetical protein AAF533_01420 [Acidobacteriota bacterium]